jgi:DNA repair exonuclease SbcCD nuclease subunit
MKILFSADHHIKLGQKNVPRDWQKNRYNMLWKKLHELEEECDMHILGGDIFDRIATPEELSMYFDFIAGCKIPTFIYDGNHEALKKGETFLKFLAEASNNINKDVHIIDGIAEIEGIDFIPYTHLKTFNPKDFHNKILCTHVRGNIPPHVVEEIDLTKFEGWEVVLAGDLHSYANSQENILYPGSPVSITFHRNEIENGVIIFDTDTMTHEFIPLGLPQLIRKTVSSKEDIVPTTYNHTIYEITGNLLELSDIDTASEFIDKKIVDKKTDSILNLKDITLGEELELYLREVVVLSEDDIVSTMKVFNDYTKEFGMG